MCIFCLGRGFVAIEVKKIHAPWMSISKRRRPQHGVAILFSNFSWKLPSHYLVMRIFSKKRNTGNLNITPGDLSTKNEEKHLSPFFRNYNGSFPFLWGGDELVQRFQDRWDPRGMIEENWGSSQFLPLINYPDVVMTPSINLLTCGETDIKRSIKKVCFLKWNPKCSAQIIFSPLCCALARFIKEQQP